MEIRLTFDPDLIRKYGRARSSPSTGFWCMLAGTPIPAEPWFERAGVLLPQWMFDLGSVLSSHSHNRCEWLFYECPEKICVTRCGGNLRLETSGGKLQVTQSIDSVVRELMRASREVRDFFTGLGVASHECEMLQRELLALRRATERVL